MATLEVLHSDNHILAVNKPAGVPVVPDSSGDTSLVELAKLWVKKEFQKPGKVFLGVVHRLDRPVSGVVVFARTSKGASRLSDAWRRNDVSKKYWAIGHGTVEADSGELRQHLFKDREKNVVRVCEPNRESAKEAITNWQVLKRNNGRVFFEMKPITGRSHQLRVAASHMGAPLLGDLKYGADNPLRDKSIALHAWQLTIPHPTLGKEILIMANPPEVFKKLWMDD